MYVRFAFILNFPPDSFCIKKRAAKLDLRMLATRSRRYYISHFRKSQTKNWDDFNPTNSARLSWFAVWLLL